MRFPLFDRHKTFSGCSESVGEKFRDLNKIHFHLHVEVDDFVAVYVFHRLADLFHETGARPLCQHKVFVDHPLEQLAALDSVECAV